MDSPNALDAAVAAQRLVLFFAAIFATFRIVAMITGREEGPWGILAWVREKTAHQGTWVARGIHCALCVSFWAGVVVALMLWQSVVFTPGEYLTLALGLSGMVVFAKYRGWA